MTDPGRRVSIFSARRWLLALGVLGVLLYAPGLDIPYYSDDFYFVLADPGAPWLERFAQRNQEAGWYRPIEEIVLGEIQSRAGLDPRPLHLVLLVAHIALAWMVWFAAWRLGAPRFGPEIASTFFLVWQTNAMAVLSNDTLSQVLSTAFGAGAALALWAALDPPPAGRRVARAALAALSILLFAAALFTKESGIGFLPVLMLLLAFHPAADRRGATRVVAGLALALVVGLYFHLRATAAGAAMPSVGEGRYQFRLGPNVAANAAKLVLSTVLPTSSLAVFDAWQAGHRLALLWVAAATGGFVALVVAGLLRIGWGRVALAMTALAAMALSPTLLLNHISELYTYAATPFLAVLVGAGLAAWLAVGSRAARLVVGGAIALLLLGHVAGVRQKAALMDANGRLAHRLIARLEPHVRALPPNATMWLVLPWRPESSYSVYRVHGFELLRGAEKLLPRQFGRPDITILLVREKWTYPFKEGDVRLTVEELAAAP